MDAINCTCCGKAWTSNKIIKIQEEHDFKKNYFFWGRHWSKGYWVTYDLHCENCDISTPLTKWFWEEDFKPVCKKEQSKQYHGVQSPGWVNKKYPTRNDKADIMPSSDYN